MSGLALFRRDDAPARAAAPRRRRRWLRWETLLGLAIVVDFAVNAFASPYFLDPWTLSDVSTSVCEKAIVALAMAFVIMTGEIDISVAGIIALCSTACGFAAAAGCSTPVLVLLALAVGAGCGLCNGLLVTAAGVPSIVATIGTMTLFRGVGAGLLGDGVLKSYPAGFTALGQGNVWGPVSIELVLFAVLAIAAALVLHATPLGRRLRALGSNPTAALMSGIRVGRLRAGVFVCSGLASGLAAVLLTGRLGSTRPSIAGGWELDIITMAILGGMAIEGGSGTIGGVVLAAILLGLVDFGLALLNIPGIVMSVITGALLIAVVGIPAVGRRLGRPGGRS